MSMQSLEIISVNFWQTLISLCNLLIIFLIMKKFLFKPVQAMMKTRREQVDKIYSDADESRESANQMKQEYEQKMASARQEADSLIKSATQTAQRKSDQIVAEANSQASHVKQKAEEEIAQQKKQMLQDFVDEFIQNVGEQQ